MYTLTRKRDSKVLKYNSFLNIIYKLDGNSTSDFPPKIGSGIIVFDKGSMTTEHWRTTVVKSVEKISDKEYNFTTKNSEYNIKRDKS